MSNLIVKNGVVYDPINNISGEKKDILIENGKIVDNFKNVSANNVKTIDASGKTVLPGAIDIHAHIASQQVNNVRMLGLGSSEFSQLWHGLTLEYLAREYIIKGYTFIVEANVFPSLAKQTLFNFNHIPILDKAMLINASNLWALELEYQKGNINNSAIFLSDLLGMLKGFGFKIYNPFEGEEWNYKELRDDISKSGRLYNFNALEVYKNITKINESLGLPHSIHAHIDGYESGIGKSNAIRILEEIKNLGIEPNQQTSSKRKRSQIFHLAHASAYGFDDCEGLINFFNSNDKCDLDVGFVNFNKISPLITSDRRLSSQVSFPIIRGAIESEGDHFETLRILDKNNLSHCYLWSNALSLALGIKDKWKVQFAINFPNYAHLQDIPTIIEWLLNKERRDEFIENSESKHLMSASILNSEDTLSLAELITITRASPAKSLGLADIKGNLGVGADADINILNCNLQDLDPTTQINEISRAFSNIEIVIKNGMIVKDMDKIKLTHEGSIFWSQGIIEDSDLEKTMKNKKDYYKKYSSIFYNSFEPDIESLKLIEI
jgi:formylmethanofuran dehydrogenase subunit A